MKKYLVLTAAILMLVSGAAMAGKTSELLVSIDLVERMAMGNMTSARFSDNDEEMIGCGTRTTVNPDGTSFKWGFCQASLSDAEENAFCFTMDDNLIAQINASSDYSYLTFRWDENGDCTYVGQSTQSFYIPGKKAK